MKVASKSTFLILIKSIKNPPHKSEKIPANVIDIITRACPLSWSCFEIFSRT